MGIDIARHIIRKSFQVSRELGDTLQFLKEKCEPDEYQSYATDIGLAIAAVHDALLEKAIKAHPAPEKEIEDQIATYDRYL